MLTLAEWARAPRPPSWLWLALAAAALYAALSLGLAHGFSKCPTWAECWDGDLACEKKRPRRDWKPCDREVRRCFERWERCDGTR